MEKGASRIDLSTERRLVVTAQLARLFFTPNAWLRGRISMLLQRIGIPAPHFAVHIRRGDKLTDARPTQAISLMPTSLIAALIRNASASLKLSRPRVLLMSDVCARNLTHLHCQQKYPEASPHHHTTHSLLTPRLLTPLHRIQRPQMISLHCSRTWKLSQYSAPQVNKCRCIKQQCTAGGEVLGRCLSLPALNAGCQPPKEGRLFLDAGQQGRLEHGPFLSVMISCQTRAPTLSPCFGRWAEHESSFPIPCRTLVPSCLHFRSFARSGKQLHISSTLMPSFHLVMWHLGAFSARLRTDHELSAGATLWPSANRSEMLTYLLRSLRRRAAAAAQSVSIYHSSAHHRLCGVGTVTSCLAGRMHCVVRPQDATSYLAGG